MNRIVSIDNLSGKAYTLASPGPESHLLFRNPREIANECRNGTCDAALLPTASLRELEDLYEPIGAYGIACCGEVGSVRLFSTRPIRSLVLDGHPIHVAPESITSQRLIQTLWRIEYDRDPQFVDSADEADAQLLIGDRAIKAGLNPDSWTEVVDLGQWWYEKMHAPFVFARWVVRRGIAGKDKDVIRDWLERNAARSESEEGLRELVLSGLSRTTSEAFARKYYRRVHARLNAEDIRGLRAFQAYQESQAA